MDSQRYEIKKRKFNIIKYSSISPCAKTFKCIKFIKILVIFVQQWCWKNDNINRNNYKIHRMKKDSFKINELAIYIHDALSD